MQSEKEIKMIISNENLNYADFEFKEADSTKDSEIEISYKLSKISRKYQTGHGTSWPADFEFDLKTNFFGTR